MTEKIPPFMKDDDDAYLILKLEEKVKKVAFLAIVGATFACATLVIALPIFYNSLLQFHAKFDHDAKFCRMKTESLARDMKLSSNFRMRAKRSAPIGSWSFGRWKPEPEGTSNYHQRQVSYDQSTSFDNYAVNANDPGRQPNIPSPNIGASSFSSAGYVGCTCHFGPQGPLGEPGNDGTNGVDGQPGNDGRNGNDGVPGQQIPPCQRECPTGPPGPAGPPGLPGQKGAPGADGEEGPDGCGNRRRSITNQLSRQRTRSSSSRSNNQQLQTSLNLSRRNKRQAYASNDVNDGVTNLWNGAPLPNVNLVNLPPTAIKDNDEKLNEKTFNYPASAVHAIVESQSFCAGPPGLEGPAGEPGNPGSVGNPGEPGVDGQVVDTDVDELAPDGPAGPVGVPGPPGNSGSPGKEGQSGDIGEEGDVGLDGTPGVDGLPGEPGPPGDAGPLGTCGHCPPPRLSNGYFITTK